MWSDKDFPPLGVIPTEKKRKEKGDEFKDRFDKKQGQTFRLLPGGGINGGNTWYPVTENKQEFQGYVTKGGHIEYVGKGSETAGYYDEFDDGHGDSRFGDAESGLDDFSQPDVQSQLHEFRTKRPKTMDSNADDTEPFEFPDDGYNYAKHLKDPGAGVFIPIDIDYFKKIAKQKIIKTPLHGDEPAIMATYDTDHIKDNEIDEVLYAREEKLNPEEELQDDFVIQANGGVLIEDEAALEDPKMARARKAMERMQFEDAVESELNEEDFVIEEEWEEDDEEEGAEREIRDLDRQFDVAMSLYDDDDIGELQEDDPQVMGTKDISVFESVILDIQSEFAPKKRKPYVPPIPPNNDEPTPVTEDTELYEEEELVPVVITTPIQERWDCESILSTYSNLDNHPGLIADPGVQKIKLSNKTGMPLGVLPTKPSKKDEEEIPADNLGKARGEETAEQKKERKRLAKESNRVAREQKKAYKNAFKQEELRQANVLKSQSLARRVVVKY